MLKQMCCCLLLLSDYAFSDEITIENNQLKLNQSLSFATQTEELLPDNKAIIEQIKVLLY